MSIYNKMVKAIDNCNLEDYPNYPQKSFNIFNDIIMIFKRISDIYLVTKD